MLEDNIQVHLWVKGGGDVGGPCKEELEERRKVGRGGVQGCDGGRKIQWTRTPASMAIRISEKSIFFTCDF